MVSNNKSNLQSEALYGSVVDAAGTFLEQKYKGFCYVPTWISTAAVTAVDGGDFEHSKLGQTNSLAFIVHVANSHWVLVYCNKERKEMRIFDSMKSGVYQEEARRIVQKFLHLHIDRKRDYTVILSNRHTSQQGVIDCGIYALAYLEAILMREDDCYKFPQVTPTDIEHYRNLYVRRLIEPGTKVLKSKWAYPVNSAKFRMK